MSSRALTRVEVRMEPIGASVVGVATQLRSTLDGRPSLAQPSVGVLGRYITISFVVGEDTAFGPAVHRALDEIRSAFQATGLPGSASLRLSGIAVPERGADLRGPWSSASLRQRAVDRAELERIVRWPRASRLRATLEREVEEAARRAGALARLEEDLRRLG